MSIGGGSPVVPDVVPTMTRSPLQFPQGRVEDGIWIPPGAAELKPVAGQRVPDAAEEARVRAESAARMGEPGPRAEADRKGLSDYPRPFEAVAECARVAGEAWNSASAKMVTAFEGVKFPTIRDLSDALQVPDETASAGPDDFEPPELCSVCGKPKSKRLGLVLSTGTHLRCKAAQVRAQVRAQAEEAEAELKAEKDGLAEDLAEKEAEVAELEEGIDAVIHHPEIGDLASRLIDDLPSPESALRRRDEQAAFLKEPPPRHHFGGAPDGGVLDVSPPREPGELIHFFGLQDRGAYPFGKDRPETITALCGQKTAAKTSDLEPTVARLDTPENVPKNANCLLCVRNWSPENRVFPAYVKPSQLLAAMELTESDKLPTVSVMPVRTSGPRRKR